MIPFTTVKYPETGCHWKAAWPDRYAERVAAIVGERGQSVPLERCEWVTLAGQLPVKLCAIAAPVKVKTATTKVIAMDRM